MEETDSGYIGITCDPATECSDDTHCCTDSKKTCGSGYTCPEDKNLNLGAPCTRFIEGEEGEGRCVEEDCCSDKIMCRESICTTPGLSLKEPREECSDGICTEEDCCDNKQRCIDSQICNEYIALKPDPNKKCAAEECSEGDVEECCIERVGYEECTSGSDCIDGYQCKKGRMREVFQGIEYCSINHERNWRCPEEGDEPLCQGSSLDSGTEPVPVCNVGFVEDEGRCIIDGDGHFVCSNPNSNEECLDGFPTCIGGYFYDRIGETCNARVGSIFNTDGTLQCDPGFINNHLGNCILQETRDNQPTNFEVDEDGDISCKQGYKLQEDPLMCLLDTQNGWECRRRDTRNNDGNLCCDPYEVIDGVYRCLSEPKCPTGHIIVRDSCVDPDTVENKSCIGEWSPCLADCADSTYRITQEKEGSGEDCKDSSGNVLTTGSTRSCKGRGSCTKYSDLLCGANLDNIIVDDLENWEWEWANENTRDRCDQIYRGNLPDCLRINIGDDATRRLCRRYTGKCRGNTNPAEDIDCSSRDNSVFKPNAYNIDIVGGDGYGSCCRTFDAEELLEQGIIDPSLATDERVLSGIGITDQDEIDRLMRIAR